MDSLNNIEMVWVDLETTGLDRDDDEILEICLVGTDKMGNNPVTIINELVYPSRRHWSWWKSNMKDIVREMHTKSGLIEDIDRLAADPAYAEAPDVEESAIQALCRLGLEPGTYEMCGNSVGFDRGFIEIHMPKLFHWFHYRITDVTTLKNTCRRLNARIFEMAPEKTKGHRAYADIMETLEEYKYYVDNFLYVAEAQV